MESKDNVTSELVDTILDGIRATEKDLDSLRSLLSTQDEQLSPLCKQAIMTEISILSARYDILMLRFNLCEDKDAAK